MIAGSNYSLVRATVSALFIFVMLIVLIPICSGQEIPAEFNYFNNAGIGFYRQGKLFPQFPAPAATLPESMSGDYPWRSLGSRQGYWRAPSGYYYPWCPALIGKGAGAGAKTNMRPVYQFREGRLEIASPPLLQALSDLRDYMQPLKDSGAIADLTAMQLQLQLDDLEAAAKSLGHDARTAGSAEEKLRIRANLLYAQVVRALSH